MVLNKLISAIANAIYAEFGDEYSIYAESMEQGVEKPCFFIGYINPSREQAYGTRTKTINAMQIRYHPVEEQSENRECNDIADRLYECLEVINYEDKKIRGTKPHHEISDGVLVFMINYDYHIAKPEDKKTMETLEYDGGVRDGES